MTKEEMVMVADLCDQFVLEYGKDYQQPTPPPEQESDANNAIQPYIDDGLKTEIVWG
jgi:hypothetical protein